MAGEPGLDAIAGGPDESMGLDMSAGQLRLWRMAMRARYAAILVMAVAALLPVTGPRHPWISALLVTVVLPYNALCDRDLRRHQRMHPAGLICDQAVAVAFLAIDPTLVSQILLVLLAIDTTAVFNFGRRVAMFGTAVGWVGVAAVLAVTGDPAHGANALVVYCLTSALIVWVVGAVVASEREGRQRYVDLIGGIDAIVWERQRDGGDSLYVNTRANDLIGYSPERWAHPQFWLDHVHPDDRTWVEEAYRVAIGDRRDTQLEYRFVGLDGADVWVQDRVRIERGPAGVTTLRGVLIDISARKRAEEQMAASVRELRHQALHDDLTDLPNRVHLTERLRQALARSGPDQQPVGLLFMDLDQFKEINNTLGHDQGDRLLVELSDRLRRLVGSDTTLVARLGGDEFAVLMTEEGDLAATRDLATRILAGLTQPFQIGGITVQVSASIGIAVHPDGHDGHDGDDDQVEGSADALARQADVAMYLAKRSGVGLAVYTSDGDRFSRRRLSLLGELRRAIAEDELVLHFQPSVRLADGSVAGAEALVRWQHPVHGLLPPTEFIELAEVSGSIHALTHWVVERAVDAISSWQALGIDLGLAVNLSVRNLHDRDLPRWLDALLDARGVPASRLTLEITENILMDDPAQALEVLGRLRALGVATSIDDFGTGYSSLAYLKNLPVDELKIDRSFVGSMVTDASDLTIVRSVIDLSHHLGLDVVAEGVEDADTLAQLAEMGCDRAQGFYLSCPLPADELLAWLADDRTQAGWWTGLRR